MARILLIESDTLLAQSYVAALKHRGHEVAVATGAQSAIDASDETTPDLIILELQLADHNGVEFLYEFRSYPEWRNIPIIVLSVVPPLELGDNHVLWKELAISNYFYKPSTSLRQLLRGVEELVTSPA